MKVCQNSYETDGLVVRIVDSNKIWKDSVDYCQQFGEELAPINNQKRLDDTLDQLDRCYKTDVHGVRTQVEERMRNGYRVGFSFQNGTGSWSDGTPLDVDEQKSLFASNIFPSSFGNTFLIQKNRFKSIETKLMIGDDYIFPFLCSKNKLTPTSGKAETTSYQSVNKSLIFGFSFSIALLLIIIGLLIYKLLQKRNINHQTKESSNDLENSKKFSLEVVDDDYATINFQDEKNEFVSSEAGNPRKESGRGRYKFNQPASTNFNTTGHQTTYGPIDPNVAYAVVDKKRKNVCK